MLSRVIPSAVVLLLVLASFSACDAATSDAWNIFGLIANKLRGPNHFDHRSAPEPSRPSHPHHHPHHPPPSPPPKSPSPPPPSPPPPPPPPHAHLASLSVSEGSLTPRFNFKTFDYKLHTGRKEIEVIPSTADRKFSITVDGSRVESGSSYSVSLSNKESHTFEIVVSGPGHDSSSYRVHAKRLVYWTLWRIVITIIIITVILVVVLLLAALAFAFWKGKWPFGSVGGESYSAIPIAEA